MTSQKLSLQTLRLLLSEAFSLSASLGILATPRREKKKMEEIEDQYLYA